MLAGRTAGERRGGRREESQRGERRARGERGSLSLSRPGKGEELGDAGGEGIEPGEGAGAQQRGWKKTGNGKERKKEGKEIRE